jgi:hypothetical protein
MNYKAGTEADRQTIFQFIIYLQVLSAIIIGLSALMFQRAFL